MNVKYFSCRDCGAQVCWLTSKAGKRYLAEPWQWVGGDYSLHEKMIPAGHKCIPNPAWREQKAAADLLYVAGAQKEGTIVAGVTVDVVKGRKVPIGTRAEVAWIGDSGYGPSGALLIDGQRVYTALSNVKAAPVEDFPQYLEVLAGEAEAVKARLMGVTA